MSDDLLNDSLLSGVPVKDGKKLLEPVELRRMIGEGGMGRVYLGRHLNLEIDVAVKVLDPELARRDPDFVARFKREGRIAASIRHTNLVHVYDVREHEGVHYIVMEFVRGRTALQASTPDGPLPVIDALDIIAGAARGLAAAHAEGVIHRDIKPENILLDQKNRVKVADLGLAKAVAADAGITQTSMRMGTPRYMPPEQWDDAKNVGPSGDVWALGATFYYLLTGEHAIHGESFPEILKRVCLEPFPDVREARAWLPEEIVALIARCTEKEPGKRFRDAGELEKALNKLKADLKEPEAFEDASRLEDSGLSFDGIQVEAPPGARMDTTGDFAGIERTIAPTLADRTKSGDPPAAPPRRPALPPAPDPFAAPSRKKLYLALGAIAIVIALVAIVAPLVSRSDERAEETRWAVAADDARKEALAAEAHWQELAATPGIVVPPQVASARAAFDEAEKRRKADQGRAAAAAYEKARDLYRVAASIADEKIASDAAELEAAAKTARAEAVALREGLAEARRQLDQRWGSATEQTEKEVLKDLKLACEREIFSGSAHVAAESKLTAGDALLSGGQFGAARDSFAQSRDEFLELKRRLALQEPLVRAARSRTGAEAAARKAENWFRDKGLTGERLLEKPRGLLASGDAARDRDDPATARSEYEGAAAGFAAAEAAGPKLIEARDRAGVAKKTAHQVRETFIGEAARLGVAEAAGAAAGEAAFKRAGVAERTENFAGAETEYRTSETRFREALADLQAHKGLRMRAEEASRTVASAAAAWKKFATEREMKEPPEIAAAAKSRSRGNEALEKRDYAEAVKAYEEAERIYLAAVRAGAEQDVARKAMDTALAAARESLGRWDALVAEKGELEEPAEVGAANAAMEAGLAFRKKFEFEQAQAEFEKARAGYEKAWAKHSIRAPEGWEIVDARPGADRWARKAKHPGTGIVFILVDPGTFQRGSTERDDEQPRREIRITKPFYLAQFETQVEAWQRFVEDANYAHNPDKAEPALFPVGYVSWLDATAFCKHYGFRLPTEAEWEYACRAGSNEERYGEPEEIAWYRGFSFRTARRKSGGKRPNAWGFHDMLGNVWEWCADAYAEDYYAQAPQENPQHRVGTRRVRRGGSHKNFKGMIRAARRDPGAADERDEHYGFRPAFTPK